MTKLLASTSCLAALLASAALAGCGGDKTATPDAPVVKIVDAAIDAAPDAPACPKDSCEGTCVDLATDPMHCGSCTNACQSGGVCGGTPPACSCPAAFLQPTHAGSANDIFQNATANLRVGIGFEPDAGGLNGLIIGWNPAMTMTGQAYNLAGAVLGTPPLVAAGYHFDMATFQPKAAFYATAGTLTFTSICASGVSGTLTDAQFSAVAGLMNPTVDPAGCGFSMASLTFSLGAPCN